MRKPIQIISLLLIFVMLGACGMTPEQTAACTDSVSSEPPMTQEVIVTEAVPTSSPTEDDTLLAQYAELLKAEAGHPDYTLETAMGIVFDAPEEISLHWFFYNGFQEEGDRESRTEEEQAFLDSQENLGPYDVQTRPTGKIEQVLQAVFGISLEDVSGGIPERWAYFDRTDCYYSTHGDCYFPGDYIITDIQESDDGTVKIHYTATPEDIYLFVVQPDGEFVKATELVLTLQKRGDGTWAAVSNQILTPSCLP